MWHEYGELANAVEAAHNKLDNTNKYKWLWLKTNEWKEGKKELEKAQEELHYWMDVNVYGSGIAILK